MAGKSYVYILKCGDNTLYTGYTNDLQKRLEKHHSGKGAKYTRSRGPFELVYWEEFGTKEEAMKREWEIKQLTREEKVRLIAGKGDKPMDKGCLYLCATPIGNLEDITYRVIRILKEADLIAAEDTRHTRKLLSFYDIHNKLTSYHEHNKKVKGPILIEKLLAGAKIALVSDAGTPGISDPGADLVRSAIEKQIPVVALPGPTAFVAALTVSGMATEEFAFYGFLPTDKKLRRQKIEKIAQEQKTVILYESPHRIKATLAELHKTLGDREAVIARELTKKYEEVQRSSLGALADCYHEKEPKGEFCLIIAGGGEQARKETAYEISVQEQVAHLVAEGTPKKEAVKEVARLRGLPKREVYNMMLKVEKDE